MAQAQSLGAEPSIRKHGLLLLALCLVLKRMIGLTSGFRVQLEPCPPQEAPSRTLEVNLKLPLESDCGCEGKCWCGRAGVRWRNFLALYCRWGSGAVLESETP